MLNDQFSLRDNGVSNYLHSTELPRHRWYFYKEGFSPKLVEEAIKSSELEHGSVIIDPFNGSGTTSLTSSMLGYESFGIEVNPFTSFLSEVKQFKFNHNDFARVKYKILEGALKGSESQLAYYSTFSEKGGADKWLFNSDILDAFEGGWQGTYSIRSHREKKIFRLALIIAAMNNCNAKKDGKCLRYRPTWKEKNFNTESFILELSTILDIIEEDLSNSKILRKATLISGDVRQILTMNKIKKFDLCLTSPPYLNTFDYTDIYRPELFLGKFIANNEQLYKLRLRTVRSHIQASWSNPKIEDFGLIYQKSMKHILDNRDLLMSNRIPLMVQAYFEDMRSILTRLRGQAKKRSSLWLIVSNSAYAGMEVPVDLILGDIGNQSGWFLKEIGILRYLKKRKSKHSSEITQLRESVVIFDSTKK